MYLQDTPGVWIPLSDEEFERAGELHNEIAELAQTAPESERHMDRLTKLSLLIGTAAVGGVVAETEGPEAGEKWRAKHSTVFGGQLGVLASFFIHAWQKWRQDKARAQAIAQGKVIALNAQANARKP